MKRPYGINVYAIMKRVQKKSPGLIIYPRAGLRAYANFGLRLEYGSCFRGNISDGPF